MNPLVRAFALILGIVMFCGCGSDRNDEPEVGPIVLGYSQLGDESTWRSQNSRSIINAADEAGIKIMFENAMQNPDNQIKAIRSFIAYKVDVIAFSPLVETGLGHGAW